MVKGTIPLERKKSFIIGAMALKFGTEMFKVILRLFILAYFLQCIVFDFFKTKNTGIFLNGFTGCNFEGRALRFFALGSLFVPSQNLVVYIPNI